MTPQGVPGGISLDQLVPWLRSLELRPVAGPSSSESRRPTRPEDADLRRAA
jgi:hypothetical protein